MDIYNSLTRQKEPFVPRADRASLYVCGITPYDTTHLGHAFTYHTFDVLIRTLEAQGVNVTYTQNVTDVDDDLLRRARTVGKDWRALGNQWTSHFIRDMRALNVLPPRYFPRASDAIADIVALSDALIRQGYAYASGGSVFFDADAFPRYGALSRIPRAQMLAVANERGNRPDDPRKRRPLDFVLWQAQSEGEPAWDSPWGPGRPGWHIECTAISRRCLGDTIDIHGGGGDLIFPHHECELAQAEAASRVSPFVRIWMHAAMVGKDGEKMSKSLGNLVMVSNLLKHYSPDAIRLYLASHHYREPWEWSTAGITAAAQMASRWSEAAQGTPDATTPLIHATRDAVISALADDLDTPRVVATLERLCENIRSGFYQKQGLLSAQSTLRAMSALLGLRLGAAQVAARVGEGWDEHLQRFTENSSPNY